MGLGEAHASAKEEGGMTTPPMDTLTILLAAWALGGGLLFLVLVAWRFPKQALWLIFLSRPLLEASRLIKNDQGFVQAVINACGVLIPVILFAVLLLRGEFFAKGGRIAPCFMLVFLIASVGHGLNAESGTLLLKVLMPFSLLLFPSLAVKSEEDLKTFLKLIAFSSLVVIAAVLLDWHRTNVNPVYGWVQDIIPLKSGESQNRLASVFGVPTTTSFWLFQFIAVCYFLYETERSSRRWFWLGICAFLSIPLYLTFSRAAWIGTALMVGLFNILKGRRFRMAAGGLAFGAAALWFLPNILFRLQNLASWKWRLLYWAGFLKSMSGRDILNWVTGLGLTDLPEKNLFTGSLFNYGSTGIIENSFVFILVGAGGVALLLFVGLFVSLAKTARFLSRMGASPFIRDFGRWSLSMLAAWLVMGMSGEMVTYAVINWYWYVFFGCLAALGIRARRSAEAPAGVFEPSTEERPFGSRAFAENAR
jgi:hypothetical protein